VSEIADTALRIIGTRGVRALSVSALAGELGITGGALYRHFPSMDAVLEAVALRVVALLGESLPDPALAPLDWLGRFVSQRARAVSDHAGLARLLFSEQLAMALPEAAVAHIQKAVRDSLATLETTIARGQAEGVIRRDLPARDLVPIVAGTVQIVALSKGDGPLHKLAPDTRIWQTLKLLISTPQREAQP
jgi:AcrR family transcriptional regulator